MFPSVASLAVYGGTKNDYSPVRDASVDRSAAGINPAYGDVAAMTHGAPRAIATLGFNGTSGLFLLAHDEGWNNGNNAAPSSPVRTGTGVYQVTYPAAVFDEIPSTAPGAQSSWPVNFRNAFANARPTGGATAPPLFWVQAEAQPVAANVLQIVLYQQLAGGTIAALDAPLATTWTPTTTYAVGQYVTPTGGNGLFYKVTTPNTSGMTAPAFPATLGSTVTDGGGVVYETWGSFAGNSTVIVDVLGI